MLRQIALRAEQMFSDSHLMEFITRQENFTFKAFYTSFDVLFLFIQQMDIPLQDAEA